MLFGLFPSSPTAEALRGRVAALAQQRSQLQATITQARADRLGVIANLNEELAELSALGRELEAA
jgi:hypothetical protein